MERQMKWGEIGKVISLPQVKNCCGKKMTLTKSSQIGENFKFEFDCRSCDNYFDLHTTYTKLLELGVEFYSEKDYIY